jgi:hypothetical protein
MQALFRNKKTPNQQPCQRIYIDRPANAVEPMHDIYMKSLRSEKAFAATKRYLLIRRQYIIQYP